MPTYYVSQAKLIVAYSLAPGFPPPNNAVQPGAVELVWRAAFPTRASDVDAACGNVQGTTYPNGTASTVALASNRALSDINTSLAALAASHPQQESLGVDPNAAAYKGGSGGSHGGSASLLDATNAQEFQDVLTVDNTNYICRPSILAVAVPV